MSLPSGYTRLEYIASSGNGAYIDTLFSPKWNTRMVLSVSNVSGTQSVALFGCRATVSSTAPLQYGVLVPATTTQLRSDYFGNNAAITVADKTPKTTLDKNANAFSAYGLTATNTAVSSGDVGISCFLFCYNNAGSADYFSAYRLYSCQIYDNGTLIRDFIPCKNASGAVGLWDDVGSQFYGNAGTGAFTAGPEVLGSHKVMVGGTIYDVTAGQCMVGGTVYAIQKGLTMIGGTVYEIPLTVPVQGTPVGNLPVGTIVKTPVNGTAKEFIVVHQGLPSSLYDASCSGTWLLMKDIYENRQWHSSSSNAYAASTIHSYLNGAFLNLFDAGIKAQIKTVKIPYAYGGTSGTVASGANGLSAKIFLLGGYEVGYTTSDSSVFPVDGAKLSYFTAGSGGNSKRVAHLNGSATSWWLRSSEPRASDTIWNVYSSGDYVGFSCYVSCGVRPAFILPFDALVDENMNLLA